MSILNVTTGSAAVTFMSYTTIADKLEPSFYEHDNSDKTIMSTVVTVNLYNTPYQFFTKPVNFTLSHINVSYIKTRLVFF